MRGFFVGVRVWHSDKAVFANGNSDFNATTDLLEKQNIQVETTENYESDQKQAIEQIKESGEFLVCSLCEKEWSVSNCSSITVKRENLVIFTCPSCRVPSLYELKNPVTLNYPTK